MQKLKSIKRENPKKEKAKLKAHSGITLIALVITIIVLLILAGVALSALTGNSGILSNAEKAKEQTKLANAKEQVELAVQGALLKGVKTEGTRKITYGNLKEELDNVVGNYSITPEGEADSWEVKVGNYKAEIFANGSIQKARDTETLAGILTTQGTTPWLPEGFSRVTKFTDGIVIANTTNGTEGTQNYVWIEVPTTEQTITLSDGTTKTINLGEAENEEEIIEALELYAGKGTETSYRSNWKDEWYDSAGKTAGTEGINLQDDKGCGMTYSQYQTAYSSMLKSIQKYGGFWLAQYEAGIDYEKEGATTATNRTENSGRITTFTSANYAKDQYPYNYVYCREAQKIANADSTSTYTSSLPFGIQWDLVCKFLEVKNEQTGLNYADIATQSTWGNYMDTTYTPSQTAKYSKWDDFGIMNFPFESVLEKSYSKTTQVEVLLTTGAIQQATAIVNSTSVTKDANPMNIYDFAGNAWELTLEYGANTVFTCAYRGGGCDDDSTGAPAASRLACSTNVDGTSIGFRSVLY